MVLSIAIVGGFFNEVRAAVIVNSGLSLSETYNDNLFFSETNKDAGLVTGVSPSIGIAYTSRNFSLAMQYSASAQFYSFSAIEDDLFHSLSIDLDVPILNRRIKGVEVRVIEEMSFSPELPGFSFGGGEDEPALKRREALPQGFGQGVQLGRTDTFQNQAGIALSYDWSERFSLNASYANVITRFSGNQFEDRNTHRSSAGGTYRYPVSARTTWTGSYGAAWTAGNGKDQMIHSVQTGVEHQLTKLVTAKGGAGASFIQDESLRPTFSGEISKRYQSGNMSIRYSGQVATGLGVIRSVTRNQSIVGNINRRLSGRIDSYLEASYSKNKAISGNEVDLATLRGEAGVSVVLLEWLSGRLSYSYLKQDSEAGTALGRDGERNLISVTLTAVGPSWRIMK